MTNYNEEMKYFMRVCKDVDKIGGGTPRKDRNTNLELYRIITMLLIVAHHYVLQSGLTSETGPIYNDLTSIRSFFYLLFGTWGKIGINCFVLITGYFMCKSQISIKKFVKLLAEILFYNLTITSIFWISGYEAFNLKDLFKAIIPIRSIEQNFIGCYLIFYLFIPFLNMLIRQLSEKQHIAILALSIFTYVFFGTFHKVSMNYVSWFVVLYFISSYLRLYYKSWFDNTSLWGILTLAFVLTSSASVVCCVQFGERFGIDDVYYFVADSNTVLATLTGVCSFMFFKNLKVPQSRFVNAVAASTFGVLCIHDNSGMMRQWLFKDLLHVVDSYNTSFFAIYAACAVLGIFTICIVIDYLRIRFLERPFLNKLFYPI